MGLMGVMGLAMDATWTECASSQQRASFWCCTSLEELASKNVELSQVLMRTCGRETGRLALGYPLMVAYDTQVKRMRVMISRQSFHAAGIVIGEGAVRRFLHQHAAR